MDQFAFLLSARRTLLRKFSLRFGFAQGERGGAGLKENNSAARSQLPLTRTKVIGGVGIVGQRPDVSYTIAAKAQRQDQQQHGNREHDDYFHRPVFHMASNEPA